MFREIPTQYPFQVTPVVGSDLVQRSVLMLAESQDWDSISPLQVVARTNPKRSFRIHARYAAPRLTAASVSQPNSRVQAGILLEVLKDMFYQCFVRRGKLTRALKVRKFFVQESNGGLASSA